MTYARKKAAAPAKAAKLNDAERPDAAPVNGVPDGEVTGAPVATGLVAFFAGAMEPVPLATGPGAPAALETVATVGATVTVL